MTRFFVAKASPTIALYDPLSQSRDSPRLSAGRAQDLAGSDVPCRSQASSRGFQSRSDGGATPKSCVSASEPELFAARVN